MVSQARAEAEAKAKALGEALEQETAAREAAEKEAAETRAALEQTQQALAEAEAEAVALKEELAEREAALAEASRKMTEAIDRMKAAEEDAKASDRARRQAEYAFNQAKAELAEMAKVVHELEAQIERCKEVEKALRAEMKWAYCRLREVSKRLNLTYGCYTHELSLIGEVVERLQLCELPRPFVQWETKQSTCTEAGDDRLAAAEKTLTPTRHRYLIN